MNDNIDHRTFLRMELQKAVFAFENYQLTYTHASKDLADEITMGIVEQTLAMIDRSKL
jgi:hypothetical protein